MVTRPRQIRPGDTGGSFSRRALLRGGLGVLAGATLGALAGCSEPTMTEEPPEPVDPLLQLVLGHRSLVERYDGSARQAPSLGARLAPLAAQVTAHRDALEAALPATVARVDDLVTPESTGYGPTATGPTATESTGTPDPSNQSPPASPADPAAVLAELRLAVSVTVVRVRAAAQSAEGDLAALLGSVAAATACHERVLR